MPEHKHVEGTDKVAPTKPLMTLELTDLEPKREGAESTEIKPGCEHNEGTDKFEPEPLITLKPTELYPKPLIQA